MNTLEPVPDKFKWLRGGFNSLVCKKVRDCFKVKESFVELEVGWNVIKVRYTVLVSTLHPSEQSRTSRSYRNKIRKNQREKNQDMIDVLKRTTRRLFSFYYRYVVLFVSQYHFRTIWRSTPVFRHSSSILYLRIRNRTMNGSVHELSCNNWRESD